MTEINRATFDIEIACSLTAAELIERRGEFGHLLARAEDVTELSDGYALRFPNDDALIEEASRLVVAERKCCPFFTFALAFEPDSGPVWLHICGSREVKELIRQNMLPPHLRA